MSDNTGNTIIALLTGAIVGAGFGILYAPDKGTKTREKIKEKAISAKDEISSRVSKVADEITQRAEATKEEFEHRLDKAVTSMSYKAEDIINAMERKLEELKAKNAKLQKSDTPKLQTPKINS